MLNWDKVITKIVGLLLPKALKVICSYEIRGGCFKLFMYKMSFNNDFCCIPHSAPVVLFLNEQRWKNTPFYKVLARDCRDRLNYIEEGSFPTFTLENVESLDLNGMGRKETAATAGKWRVRVVVKLHYLWGNPFHSDKSFPFRTVRTDDKLLDHIREIILLSIYLGRWFYQSCTWKFCLKLHRYIQL